MNARKRSPQLQGIDVRHVKGCPNFKIKDRAKCSKCDLSYRAAVYDASIVTERKNGTTKQGGYHRSKWSKSLADVRGWRTEKMHGVATGTLAVPSALTVREAFATFCDLAEQGQVSTRSGRPYKPSVVRAYRGDFRRNVDRPLGATNLSALRRNEIQALVDRLRLEHDPSTVRNSIVALRAMCKWAVRRPGLLTTNPTTDLDLPIVTGQREKVVTPQEGRGLIEALPERDRAMWATALYAGLRLGELQALRGRDLVLLDGTISVEHSWDPKEGLIDPKSAKGYRTIGIPRVLRDDLEAHIAVVGAIGDDDYVFARLDGRPFAPSSVHQRARRKWKDAGLDPVGFHDLRHSCATHRWAAMVLAGEPDPKALQEVMGHNDLKTTMDRYCKTTKRGKARAADAFDAFLASAD